MNGLITPLPWDSAFFGVAIARLALPEPVAEDLSAIDAACRDGRIDCLYALVGADQRALMQAMEESGFRTMDIRMTLACPLDGTTSVPAVGVTVRHAVDADVPSLERIARVSHRDGRFYADPRFDRGRCDELYATWIARSCDDYADAVLVAEVDGRPAGYITADVRADGAGSIGLFAVAPEARGRGAGTALIDAALRWFAGRGCKRVEVVTQGCNTVAQRAYQKHGFRTAQVQVWFHKWYDFGRKAD